MKLSHHLPRPVWTVILGLFLLALPQVLCAQQYEELDNYKIRLDAFFFSLDTAGSVIGDGANDIAIDFQRGLGFKTLSTTAGKLDLKFTHRSHFYVAVVPYWASPQATLNQTFTFRGQQFNVGLVSNSDLHALLVAPGYQYDILRRRRGHLGLAAQADLLRLSARITAAGQVDGIQKTVGASDSLLVPIPLVGPEFRLYLTNSPWVFIEGNACGMDFGQYGNLVSGAGNLGIKLNKHLSLNFGYQLGSRLIITRSSNRIGLDLTQKGPIAGLEFSL